MEKKENEFDGVLYNNDIQSIAHRNNELQYFSINNDSINTNINYKCESQTNYSSTK